MPTQFLPSGTFNPKPLSRQTLINHLMSGFSLTLERGGVYIDHKIIGISLESGFPMGTKPRHFNLDTDKGPVYVYTEE